MKDGVVYIFGEVFSKGLPFLLLPYLSRSLGTSGYGELSLAQLYIAMAFIFINISQEGAIARYYYVYGVRSLNNVILAGRFYSLIALVVMILFGFFYDNDFIILIAMIGYSQSIFSVQLSVRQCQKHAYEYVIFQILCGLLSVVLTVLIFEAFTASVNGRLYAILLSNTIVSLLAMSFLKINSIGKFTRQSFFKSLRYILSFGLPLIFHQGSLLLKGQFDRVFMLTESTMSEVGIYSMAFQLASIFSIIIMAVNKAVLPYYYEAQKNGSITRLDVLRLSVKSFLFSLLLVLLIVMIPEDAFLYFLGHDFLGVKSYFMMFAMGFSLQIPILVLINRLFYFNNTMVISKITIMSSLLHLVTAYLLSRVSVSIMPTALIVSNLFHFILLYHENYKDKLCE